MHGFEDIYQADGMHYSQQVKEHSSKKLHAIDKWEF